MPHILETASNAEAAGHALEGATKADAVLIAPMTGFASAVRGESPRRCLRRHRVRPAPEPDRPQHRRHARTQPEPARTADPTTAGQNVLRAHHARNPPRPPREPPVRLADARLPEGSSRPPARPDSPSPPRTGPHLSFQPAGMAHVGGLQQGASRRLPVAARSKNCRRLND